MFCSNCGKEIDNVASFCPYCGKAVGYFAPRVGARQSGLKTAAEIFAVISCVRFAFSALYGIFFLVAAFIYGEADPDFASNASIVGGLVMALPLCWAIPMTISLFRKAKSGEYISVGFKICVLIFLNIIAGILLLCDNEY